MGLYNRKHIFSKPYEGKSIPRFRLAESPRMLKRGRLAAGEHGSGEAHPSGFRQGATGLPVTAEGVVGRLRGPALRRGEKKWYHGHPARLLSWDGGRAFYFAAFPYFMCMLCVKELFS